jgi:hypothetical protein
MRRDGQVQVASANDQLDVNENEADQRGLRLLRN